MEFQPAARRRASEQGESAPSHIVEALRRLLLESPIDAITVAEIISEAGVARGTFYFWFTSKYDVLAVAHRGIVHEILGGAVTWLEDPEGGPQNLRRSMHQFVELWIASGPVLCAASESWRSHPELHDEWKTMMSRLIEHVAGQIRSEQAQQRIDGGVDAVATANALVWMNERTLYMAALGTSPVPLTTALADQLADIWNATLYGRRDGVLHDVAERRLVDRADRQLH